MTVPKMLPPLARVNELLSYDPLTGEFRRRITTSSNARAGDLAGCLDADGYRRIWIDGRMHGAHRLAWLIVYGVSPTEQIDHHNGVRDENRIANLRLATSTENNRNRARRSDNSSGRPGVYFYKRLGCWRAQIKVAGKNVFLGDFDTIEEATSAREQAEITHFGEFRRPCGGASPVPVQP